LARTGGHVLHVIRDFEQPRVRLTGPGKIQAGASPPISSFWIAFVSLLERLGEVSVTQDKFHPVYVTCEGCGGEKEHKLSPFFCSLWWKMLKYY